MNLTVNQLSGKLGADHLYILIFSDREHEYPGSGSFFSKDNEMGPSSRWKALTPGHAIAPSWSCDHGLAGR